MADEAQLLGVRAAGPTARPGLDAPRLLVPGVQGPEPPVWPPAAQWCLAVLLAVGLALVGWRGWGTSRYSTRPLDRAAPRHDLREADEEVAPAPAPRLVRGKAADFPAPSGKKPPPDVPIDVNRAAEAELMRLPGIGPKLAARIVEARGERPFASVGELRRVKGIGPKTLEKLRPYVVTGDAPE